MDREKACFLAHDKSRSGTYYLTYAEADRIAIQGVPIFIYKPSGESMLFHHGAQPVEEREARLDAFLKKHAYWREREATQKSMLMIKYRGWT